MVQLKFNFISTKVISAIPAGHIIYIPGPGLPGLKFCWPGVGREPGRLGHNARDLANPGYLGCSAYLNYISGNMQYLPIKFTNAI